MGKEHLDGGECFDSWRHRQVRTVGEGAAALQAVFAVDWYNAVHENLFSAAYFRREALEAASGAARRGTLPRFRDSAARLFSPLL